MMADRTDSSARSRSVLRSKLASGSMLTTHLLVASQLSDRLSTSVWQLSTPPPVVMSAGVAMGASGGRCAGHSLYSGGFGSTARPKVDALTPARQAYQA